MFIMSYLEIQVVQVVEMYLYSTEDKNLLNWPD